MKVDLSVEVTNIDELTELTKEIRELSDLVPEWKRHEAQQHEENIEQLLFGLIHGTNKN